MRLSIVTTLYKSEQYVIDFYNRSIHAASHVSGDDYEIIFVNDGSPDNSLDLAIQIAMNDNHVIVIDLSKNFGHYKAMLTGLSHAKGQYVFLIDSDLEEDPKHLIRFFEEIKSLECDVVYGVQNQRRGNWFNRLSGNLFYILINSLSGSAMPKNVLVARLMSRRYVNALLSHKERELYIAGLWHITGFDQRPIAITKHNDSKTTYTLSKKLSIIVNSITSFSDKPLTIIFYIGLIVSLCSVIYISIIIVHWFIMSKPISGWTSLIASVWLLGGLIILFIGTIGIYLSKIFLEVKQRPLTIIRQIYKKL